MTIWFAIGAQLFCTLPIIGCGWSMVCAQRTCAERIEAVSSWRFRPFTGPQIGSAVEAVSFFQHYWARMRFRDAWKLYDPIVLDAIKNPRVEIMGTAMSEPSDAPPAMH